jgi:hypothetical protein
MCENLTKGWLVRVDAAWVNVVKHRLRQPSVCRFN